MGELALAVASESALRQAVEIHVQALCRFEK